MSRIYIWLISISFILNSPVFGQEVAEEGEAAILDTITNKYVHTWYNFPVVTGKRVGSSERLTFRPERGYANVVLFLASWCIPCQTMIRSFQALESKYKERHTRFIYVYAHDTESDARGFVKAYRLAGYNVLATIELMEAFHQPPLPTIYVGDRHGWLAWRKMEADQGDLDELDRFLEIHTAW